MQKARDGEGQWERERENKLERDDYDENIKMNDSIKLVLHPRTLCSLHTYTHNAKILWRYLHFVSAKKNMNLNEI